MHRVLDEGSMMMDVSRTIVLSSVVVRPAKVTALFPLENGLAEDGGGGF